MTNTNANLDYFIRLEMKHRKSRKITLQKPILKKRTKKKRKINGFF